MALLDLNEVAVTALATRLRDRLPALVAELNAGVEDGFTIEEPTAVLEYIPPLAQITDPPVIGISDQATTFGDDIGASATGHHTLTVVCFVVNADPQGLAWQLRRSARVIASAALEERAIDPDVWLSRLERVAWGDTLETMEDPRQWLSWVGVVLALRTEEDA